MTEDEVLEVEQQLGDLPPAYRAWLLTLPGPGEEVQWSNHATDLNHIYLTPDDLLQANLALMQTDWLKDTEWEEYDLADYVVLAGDGCGNYFICDPDDDDSPVELLSHDPVGIEDAYASIDDFLAEAMRVVASK